MNNSPFPALGGNVRRERRKKQLSLDALAASSGVSKAMLSQIESDKVNPTVGTLWKIARALQTDFGTLLSGESEKKRFEHVTMANLPRLTSEEEGIEFRVLSPVSMAEKIEMYLVTLRPGTKHVSLPHVAGSEELITVLEGTVEVTAGERSVHLETGDVLLYQSDVEHVLQNQSEVSAQLHMTVLYQS